MKQVLALVLVLVTLPFATVYGEDSSAEFVYGFIAKLLTTMQQKPLIDDFPMEDNKLGNTNYDLIVYADKSKKRVTMGTRKLSGECIASSWDDIPDDRFDYVSSAIISAMDMMTDDILDEFKFIIIDSTVTLKNRHEIRNYAELLRGGSATPPDIDEEQVYNLVVELLEDIIIEEKSKVSYQKLSTGHLNNPKLLIDFTERDDAIAVCLRESNGDYRTASWTNLQPYRKTLAEYETVLAVNSILNNKVIDKFSFLIAVPIEDKVNVIRNRTTLRYNAIFSQQGYDGLLEKFTQHDPNNEYFRKLRILRRDNYNIGTRLTPRPSPTSERNSTSFSNSYGTSKTKCAVSGCSNYVTSSGDTNCCAIHSNKCLECGKYIDSDAAFCISCIMDAATDAG